MRRNVRPHPQTVTDFSRGALVRPPRTYVRNAAQIGSYVVKVDPVVWQTAMEIADGDRFRIEVRSATEVVVHNHSKRKG
jgi:hypothetical protein